MNTSTNDNQSPYFEQFASSLEVLLDDLSQLRNRIGSINSRINAPNDESEKEDVPETGCKEGLYYRYRSVLWEIENVREEMNYQITKLEKSI